MRRFLGATFLLVLVIIVAGAAFEAIAAMGDAARYSAPGRIVEVDGRRVHVHCTGNGTPTVILEAGLGEGALTWADVQPLVAAETRVCSYDRAGYGWSQGVAGPRDAQRESDELYRLLEAAGESGPYVLAGHSIGGFVTRLFTVTYPDEVAGLILIDPTDEVLVAEGGVPAIATLETRARGVLARLGVIRLFGRSLITDAVGGEPPAAILENLPIPYGPDAMATSVAELESSADSASQVIAGDSGGLASIPVVIVSAGDAPEATLARRAGLAAQSRGGRHELAAGTTHYIHYQRLQLVADTVLAVVSSVR